MTPDERVHQEIWWVLQRIKEEIFVTEKGKLVKYELIYAIGGSAPSIERQKNIIFKLQEWRAVKIVREPGLGLRGVGRKWFKLKILQPKFDGICEKYQTPQSSNHPFCMIKKDRGYLKFGKYGKKVKIGKKDSRPFRLLEYLLETLGVARTVDTVFEVIKLPNDKNDPLLNEWNTVMTRKVELIQFAIKELQKRKKLQGKIKFEFNETKTQVMAKFLG